MAKSAKNIVAPNLVSTPKPQVNNYINHVCFVIDESGSMGNLTETVVKVFDAQVAHLAKRSQELDQETRVTIYTFSNLTRCLVYDKDVLRLPSLRNIYRPNGGTSLIDATYQALEDLQKTAQLYGDHAFLTYVITDGYENTSVRRPQALESAIKNLPDNYTVACLVPDKNGERYAHQYGFDSDNIVIWDATSAAGLEDVGRLIIKATDTYLDNRSRGVRKMSGMFKLDTQNLNRSAISTNLVPLKATEFAANTLAFDAVIADFVKENVGQFVKGNSFYQLTKPEDVQGYKKLIILDKKARKYYSGDTARQLLGLPNHDVRVTPDNFGDFEIFIQSTSVNRKLKAGTKVVTLL